MAGWPGWALKSSFFPLFFPLGNMAGPMPSAPRGWHWWGTAVPSPAHPRCPLLPPLSCRAARSELSEPCPLSKPTLDVTHRRVIARGNSLPGEILHFFFLFYFIFASFSLTYQLTRDTRADPWRLVATKNKNYAFHELSKGQNNSLLLSQDQQLRSGLFVSRPPDLSMTVF